MTGQQAAAVATTAAFGRREGLAWGALGVLAFSNTLPVTRLTVTGGIDGVVAGLGRAVVAGILAIMVLLVRRQGWPPRRLLPRIGVVTAGVVVGFPLLTSLALADVPAAHGIVASGLIPAATAVPAVLRAGERPSVVFWATLTAGLRCVVLFATTRGAGELGAADLLLLGAVTAAGVGHAEGGALSRELGGPAVTCWALVLALPITTLVVLPHLDVLRSWRRGRPPGPAWPTCLW